MSRPACEFAVVACDEGLLRSEHGLTLAGAFRLDRLVRADLVVAGAIDDRVRAGTAGELPEPLLNALQAAAARGARMLSVCTDVVLLRPVRGLGYEQPGSR